MDTGLILFGLIFALHLLNIDSRLAITPDSADYLILAKSLLTGFGYHDLSAPGRPEHFLKPPGYPFLLLPAAGFGAQSVFIAKLLTLLMGAAATGIFYRLLSSDLPKRAAFWTAILLAWHPATAYFSTNVLSEIPYIAWVLGALLIWRKSESLSPLTVKIALPLVLTAITLTRTIGLTLLAAFFIDACFNARKRGLLPWLAAGGIAAAALMIRDSAHGSGYIWNFFHLWRDNYAVPLAQSGAGALVRSRFYAETFLGYCLPFNTNWISPSILAVSDLAYKPIPWPAFQWLTPAVGAVFAALGLYGLRRHPLSRVLIIHFCLYGFLLVLNPQTEDRHIYPIYVLWLLPASFGLFSFLNKYARHPGRLVLMGAVCLPLACAAAVSLAAAPEHIARLYYGPQWVNRLQSQDLRPVRLRHDFYAMGSWIRNTLPKNTVILGDKSLFLFSGYPVVSVYFEQLDLFRLNELIQQHPGARLVVPSLWGRLTNDYIFRRNPEYEFKTETVIGDLALLAPAAKKIPRIDPGLISYGPQIRLLREAVSRHPDRHDLRETLAIFLYEDGQYRDAVREFQACLQSPSMRTPHRYRMMADAYLSLGELDEAIRTYRAGLSLSKSEWDWADLKFGLEVAEFKKTLKSGVLSAGEKEKVAERFLQWGDHAAAYGVFPYALENYRRALEWNPSDAAAQNRIRRIETLSAESAI